MAALVGALRVTLGANTAQYEAGMRQAQTTARRTGRDISTSLGNAQRTAINAFRGIAAAAGVGGVAAGAATFLRYADAAKSLEAQLRLATRESGSFARAQEDVRRVAAASRTGIEETANLYAVFQRNSRELGITQAEAARLTETVSKSFQISGASAAEAAGGLRQFLQGIQSGTLRGEELNSVLENAPRLARALADGLGVTIGQLRAMGAAGQLTGDLIKGAILEASDAIDAEFNALPVTFDQAMTQVRNAAIITFGGFDRGGQFSTMLANFFNQGAEGFADMATDAENAGASIRSTMASLSDVFGPMVDGASHDFGTIAAMAEGLRNSISLIMHEFQGAYNTYVDVANSVDNFGANVLNPLIRGINPAGGGRFAPGTRSRSTFADDFDRRQANEFRARSQNAGIIGAAQEQLRPRRGAIAAPGRGGGGGGGSRRRGGGGGGGRAARPRPAQRVEPADFASAYLEGPTVGEMDTMAAELEAARSVAIDLSDVVRNIPSLGDLITANQREDMLAFAQSFREDLAGGLAQAIVYGKNLGDALVSSIQRAAAALLESSLLQLLGGGSGQGGASGGFAAILGGLFGGGSGLAPKTAGGVTATGMKLPGFASGGAFMVGGSPGVDRNVLSLNGAPVAMVSRGETVGVGRGGGSGGQVRVLVDTSPLLTAIIQEGDRTAAVTGSVNAQSTLHKRNVRRIP